MNLAVKMRERIKGQEEREEKEERAGHTYIVKAQVLETQLNGRGTRRAGKGKKGTFSTALNHLAEGQLRILKTIPLRSSPTN